MNTPCQRKRKLSIVCLNSKKQRRTSIVPKTEKTNMNNSSKLTFRTARNTGRKCQTNSPTLIQNNRELATALNKAKSRIRELEDQRFDLQGDKHQLLEKYNMLTKQLQKMKDEQVAKQTIDDKIFREICESLRSKLQTATEKLLESSVFLAEVDKSVTTILKMSASQNGENQNRSVELSLPLEITCDDSMQGSKEAALSITKLTPSPSSASSSDSYEMTSPELSADSTPSAIRPGLLTTIEDHNSTLEISDMRLVLNSTESSSVGKVLNMSQESMDCHNNSHDREAILAQLGSMDIDSPITNSNELSLAWSSTPDCSPIRCARSTVHRLASTPEDSEISRYAANLTAGSPQLSPAFTLCSGVRKSRRRNMIDGFTYKEPLIGSKLRQGDPFTDCSLIQPSKKNTSKKKKTK
ncbi:Hypothetical predicted protein [Paramuricea clavata]|uniref:Uncharacterized protein n=1 Tax=Paramuricea clavata TaxID=317549 RepID=A0A6S7H747_PARCT|nr:Hypothetical predicted protein [Paramuricea clavata]